MIPVIFRKFRDGGDIIAIFPTIPGGNSPLTCLSYMHVGQHASCDPIALINDYTDPALPIEYGELMAELRNRGYDDLDIYQRYLPIFTEARLNETKRLNNARSD